LTFCRVILFFLDSAHFIFADNNAFSNSYGLIFCYPFFITVLAKFFLRDQIGLRRWSAVIIGFIGVYIILNPNFDNFNYLKLTPILCAFCYSLSMIIIKKTSDKDDVYQQMFQFYIGALIISGNILFLNWRWPIQHN
jgi:drug/metabolite transporter (DMT)-like permease